MCLRPVISLLVLATLVLATLGDAPRAATDPAAACSAMKARAVGKNAYDEMKCQAAAAREGTVDPSCIEKAEEKLALAFTRAEQGDGCAAVGNAAALQSRVDGFVAGTVAALPGVTPTTTTTTIPPPHCPAGSAGFFPICWYAGTPGQSCDQVCAAAGRTYDPATATFAGSEGSNLGCLKVIAALNPLPLDQINVLFTRSDDCAAAGLGGLGCFARSDSEGGVAGFGRCATPPTTEDASAPGYARFCACR
jgi:hypothetical protein